MRPELLAEGLAGGPGEADPARARLALDALGHVDGVAVDPVAVLGDGAEVDPDAERQRPPAVAPDRLVPELALDLDRELQGVHRAREEGQDRVAGLVDDAPAVVGHELAEEGQGAGDPPPGAGLVALHRGAEPLRVGVEDRGGPALEAGGGHGAALRADRRRCPPTRGGGAGASVHRARLPPLAPRPVAGPAGLGRRDAHRPGGGRDRRGGHHRSSPWREGFAAEVGTRLVGRQVAAPASPCQPRTSVPDEHAPGPSLAGDLLRPASPGVRPADASLAAMAPPSGVRPARHPRRTGAPVGRGRPSGTDRARPGSVRRQLVRGS